MSDPWAHFEPTERDCVERFLALLERRLGADLRAVWLFGSFARGDVWSSRAQQRSDVDLFVLTRTELDPDLRESLVGETYPLFLECGRQIAPQFWSVARLESPPTESARAFVDRLLHEASAIHGAAPHECSTGSD